jgi:glycosidase
MVDGDFPLKGALDPIARMYAWAPKWLINLLGLNIARDDFKTPMQWDNSVNAGFTGAASKPWLPVNKDYKEKNVAAQLKDNQSLLNVFKKLLKFRKTSIAILEGGIKVIHDAGMPEDLLAYTRSYDNEKVLVLINFGKNEVVFSNTTDCTKIAFSTGNETDLTEIYKIKLEPFSGMILTNKK